MRAQTLSAAARPAERGLGTIHLLLAVQSMVVVLISINRLSSLTTGYVLPNQFLRWVDLNNMLVLPLLSLVAFQLLKQHLEDRGVESVRTWWRALDLSFVVGVYLLAAGYGDHEVTNYLNGRFCGGGTDTSVLCQIVGYNDDEFSHLLFFTGFVLMNGVLMLLQTMFPHRGLVAARDRALLVLNGLFIGAAIFANLAFEQIGLDLYVVALLAALALALLWRRGAQPLLIYYGTGYMLGLVATAIYKGLSDHSAS
jgi:hypothetical protein